MANQKKDRMRKRFKITAILFAALIYIGSTLSWAQSNPVIKLMPLGDSITRGATGASNNIGDAGYRYPLINLLKGLGYTFTTDGGNDFDFVGTNTTGNTSVVGNFDVDNQGISGMQALNHDTTKLHLSLIHKLNSYLTQNPPDIILLHIGTNDITAGDNVDTLAAEVSSLLDTIYNFNFQIHVVVAKIINRLEPDSLIDSTVAYNNALGIMAEQRISSGDNLSLVDVGGDFIYEADPNPPTFYTGDMEDNLHPNDSGHVKMAGVWFDKLKGLLTPALASPLNESLKQDTNVTFNWYPAFGAGLYNLQVATDSNFNTIYYENYTLTDTSADVSLTDNTNYYWRVRAKINTGSSPFSEFRTINGTHTYSDELENTMLPVKFELSQNYPNPFNPSTNIEFSLPHSSKVKIDVYDILGQHIQTLINLELEAGYHNVVFNAADLAGGTYIYRIITDNYSQAKKMVLLR
jgi:lysophospholipase L1-like esterase